MIVSNNASEGVEGIRTWLVSDDSDMNHSAMFDCLFLFCDALILIFFSDTSAIFLVKYVLAHVVHLNA